MRLASLEVEEALIHMLAVTGIILLVFLLAAILVKCRLYLTYPRVVDQHNGIKVRGCSYSLCSDLTLTSPP